VESFPPPDAAVPEDAGKGAATSLYLAPSPKVDVTGTYFADRKPKTSSRSSYDTVTAARLWHVSADLTSLTTDVYPRIADPD
jgi:hypothetical protein